MAVLSIVKNQEMVTFCVLQTTYILNERLGVDLMGLVTQELGKAFKQRSKETVRAAI